MKNSRLYVLVFAVLSVSLLVIFLASQVKKQSFTPSRADTTAGMATLYFSSPRVENGSVVVDVVLDTFGNPISGVDIKVSYDRNKVSVLDLERHENSPFISYPALDYRNSDGIINISANLGSSNRTVPVKGTDIRVASITYQSSSEFPFSFLFTPGGRNDSNVALAISQGEEPVDILTSVQNSVDLQVEDEDDEPESLFQKIINFFANIL